MIGLRNERLVVIEEIYKETKRQKIKYFLCQCDCGNKKLVRADGLKTGRVKSCGCLAKEMAKEKAKAMGLNNKKHGMSRNRIYKIWDTMKNRCTNPKAKDYKNYGGRGISYDPSWDIFENFLNDMNEGYADNLTIERIDVNDGYYKENCMWVTMKEQHANMQNTKFLTLNGVTKRLVEWAEILNIPTATLRSRKRAGWTDFEALTKPKR